MIALRELEFKDAPLMLEWMHDTDIQKGFQKKMLEMTLEDAQRFCEKSVIPDVIEEGCSVHFAIVDDNDEYLGTISLKNISITNSDAEYAISTRKKVHGKGIATAATGLIFEKAFNEYNLSKVYLNVLKNNERAVGFYVKNGFVYEGDIDEKICIAGEYVTLARYVILKADYNK